MDWTTWIVLAIFLLLVGSRRRTLDDGPPR